MVSTQKQCCKQKKQDLSEKRQSAINKRWSKQQAKNQIAAAAAERAKAAGKIRLDKKQEMIQSMMAKQKSAAVLPSQMSNIAVIRWSKKEAKKTAKARSVRAGNSRAVFSDRRLVRRSVSVQVDSTSKPLAKLQRENNLLLSRLVEPKSKKATPRKPLHKLGRVASLPKISQIVSLFQIGNKHLPSYDEFQKVMKQVQSRLGINSPLKPADTRRQMTPIEDLLFCAATLTWRQRCAMKTELIKRDFMENHTFWGLLSEQCIEALHAVVNRDERRLASMRERNNILRKIMECSFVRNVLFDMEIVCEDLEDILK